ncbi:MAG: helix-turn-helix transcriptional regulator [Solirubrobacterales bacterium]
MIVADRRLLLVDIASRFGNNLRRYRRASGLSQEEVGIRASLHRTEIGLLERGERIPRIDTAIKLAGAVGVTLGELTDGIGWAPGTSSRGTFSVDPSEASEN